jgi:hypothetical protein
MNDMQLNSRRLGQNSPRSLMELADSTPGLKTKYQKLKETSQNKIWRVVIQNFFDPGYFIISSFNEV